MSLKPAKKETVVKRAVEVAKLIDNIIYEDYNDQAREVFTDRIIEDPLKRRNDFSYKGSW